MAKADVLLKVGIQFDPKSIDTKAIKDAVVKQLATTNVKIEKSTFGKAAKDSLIKAFAKIRFRIQDAKFGRSGLTALRRQFKINAFSINNVIFTKRALQSLNRQLKGTKFQIATVAPAQGFSGAGKGAAAQTRDLANSQKTLQDRLRGVRKDFDGQIRSLQDLALTTTGSERANRNFLQTVSQGRVSLEGFGANIVKITQRFSAYLISIKALLIVQQAFNESLSFIFKFDAALQDLAKIVDTSRTSLIELGEGLFTVANATANSVTEVAASFGIFIRQGLTIAEALERSRIALIGVNAANISVSSSTKLVTVALRVFGDEIENGIQALDILNATADNAATSQDQIVNAILRSGSAAQAVGLSFGELNAIIAATVEQTQLSGSQIGSALKTIFARLATNTSGLREQANALGANIKPGEDLVTTLQKLADIFPNLTRDQQAQIVTLAAGKRRFTEFNALLQQFEKNAAGVSRVQELLNEQLDGAGNTAAKNAAELQKLSSRVTQTKNAFSEFIAALADIGGGGSAAGFVGDLLDALTSIGRSLTESVKFIKDLKIGLVGVGSIIKNIGKAAFFVTVPLILKGLIGGAKAFLGIGLNLGKVLGGLAITQKAFNTEIVAGNTAARQELGTQVLLTRELRAQLQLRAQINQTQIGGVTNQVRRLKEIRGTDTAVGGSRAENRLVRVGQSITSGFRKVGDGFRNQLTKAQVTLSSFGARIAATTVALQGLDAIGTLTGFFADRLETGGNKIQAGLLRAGESALKTGVQIALLGGPVAGLVAGLGILLTKATEATVGFIVNRNAAIQAANAARKFKVALGQVEKTGSEDLIEAFKDIAQAARSNDPEERARALVSADVIIIAGLRALTSETSVLNQAFKRSGEVLTEVTNQVARALRESRIDQAVQEAVGQIQQQTAERAGSGQGTGRFEQIKSLNAEIEKLASGQTDELLSQEQILNRIVQISLARSLQDKTAQEKAELNVGTTEELLQRTGSLSKALANQIARREKLRKLIESETDELGKQLKAAGLAADSIERFNKTLQQAAKTQQKSSGFAAAASSQLKIAAENQGKLAEVTKIVEGGLKNLAEATLQLSKLNKDINTELEKEAQGFDQLIIKTRELAVQADASNKALQGQIDRIAKVNTESDIRLKKEKEILLQQLNANTFIERRTILETKNNVQRDIAIKKSQEQVNADVEALRTARQRAAALGEQDVVRQLDAQIARSKQLREELSRQITTEFNLKIQGDLSTQAFQEFSKAEEALKTFRIRQIEEVVRREQEAAGRRIEFIKNVGQTAAGREFIRQTPEFRPTPGLERQFGTIRAAIIDQLTGATEIAVAGMVTKIQELRTNGVSTFQELNNLKSKEKQIQQDISEIQQRGGDTSKLNEAQNKLNDIRNSIKEVTERGADDFKLLQEAGRSATKSIALNEELSAKRREFAIELVEKASKKATESQNRFVTELNKIPALNQKIIQSQRALASAETSVEDATKSLVEANQSLADASFKLAIDIGLAEFRATQAAGGFAGVGEALASLQRTFDQSVANAKGSFEAILEARREVLQEELSLVQNQLQTFKSLAIEAATADPQALATLQDSAVAAQAIAGGAEVGQFSPEILQGLQKFTQVIPGLEQALLQFGAEKLGLDPNVFQTLEQQLVELQVGIAETGQIQVQQAEQQVRISQIQLEEARQQKDLAQQQLENSILQKEAQLQTVAAASENVIAARSGFSGQIRESQRILAQTRRGAETSKEISNGIKFLQEVEKTAAVNIKKLADITAEQLGLSKQQTEDQTKTAENTAELKVDTKESLTVFKAIQSGQNLVREAVVGSVDSAKVAIVEAVVALRSAIRSSQQGITTPVTGSARGTLSTGEINGLLSAASKEKSAMPSGSRLMLANTSETVLTTRQAARLGLRGRSQTHAQGGNAVVTPDLVNALSAAAENLGNLNNQLQTISTKASQPQNISVQLNTDRKITIEGVNNLQTDLQNIIEQKLGNTPSQNELNVISQTIESIVNRLKENGNEDFTNI